MLQALARLSHVKARKSLRPVLLLALVTAWSLTTAAAQASRPATDPERAALAQLSGFNGACLDIAFSTVDQAFAAYRLSGAAGCPQGDNYVVLRANAAGGYEAVLFVPSGERCPTRGPSDAGRARSQALHGAAARDLPADNEEAANDAGAPGPAEEGRGAHEP